MSTVLIHLGDIFDGDTLLFVPSATICKILKTLINGRKISRKCPYKEFPKHPQQKMRKECGAPLLKAKRNVNGTYSLSPYKTHVYYGIRRTLNRIVSEQ